MLRRSFVMMAAFALVLWAVHPSAADDKGGYGPLAKTAETKRTEGERLVTGVRIDTSKKPMPKDDLVVVITAHSEGGDPNHADGSFSLAKAGGGQTIHISGSRTHNVDAKLLGYGTTASGKTWVYEIDGLKVNGKKVFVAISAEYAGLEMRPVFISLGEDAPTNAGSFSPAGWAIAGKKTL